MSRKPSRPPKYRHYKPKDLAVVRIAGHDRYLGKYGSPESYERYDRLVAEWLLTREHRPVPRHPDSSPVATRVVTVNELILAFWHHAKERYVKNGEPTSELRSYKTALRPVRQLYGREPAAAFGPLALVACRQKLIEAGVCRKRINQHVTRIRHVFKWGVARELVPETVWRALCAVEGLRVGEAAETEPIRPVPEEHITAVEPFVTPQIWTMMNLQLWTGCRPGEACVMGTWDATRTYVERASAVLDDLPLICDDTQRAKNDRMIAQTIYDACSGRGRGRGSLAGIRGTDTFRTVLISSGERPLASYSEDEGARARVLECWGSVFGRADAETGAVVSQISEAVCENYGHAGRAWVQFLIENRCEWDAWRAWHRQWRQYFERRAENNPVGVRMGANLATVQVAAALAHHAGILPWPPGDTMEVLYDELAETDRAAAALHFVASWARAHRKEFAGQRSAQLGKPPGGWMGRWDGDPDKPNSWEYISFLEGAIDAVLAEAGYEPSLIRRRWRELGWLRVSPGRALYRTRIEKMGSPVGLVAIHRQAIVEAGRAKTSESPWEHQPPRLPPGIAGPSRATEEEGLGADGT